MMGWLAAVTSRIGLGTSVLVLTQRQTALVAKQAAEVDVLSGGRLRLGVGAGWNPVEFEALGVDFASRGQREEEQVDLLRQLWTNEVVTFNGKFDHVDHAGINPLPTRQIPLWLGGARDVALKRAARLGDGYLTLGLASSDGAALLDRLRGYVRAAGRDPSTFGIEARTTFRGGNAESWRVDREAWEKMGVTHLSVGLLNPDSDDPRRHIDAMRVYREAMAH
jgi:probable F420-dependent oxidoreductase